VRHSSASCPRLSSVATDVAGLDHFTSSFGHEAHPALSPFVFGNLGLFFRESTSFEDAFSA